MTTARYPKEVLLERIDAKIAGLADEQELEEQEQLKEAQQFVAKSERASASVDEEIGKFFDDVAQHRDALADESATFEQRFTASRKIGKRFASLGAYFPQPTWRLESYAQELIKIRKKYEIKKRFLEGKRSIIVAADAPDGFTMTALEKLHLLEAIG